MARLWTHTADEGSNFFFLSFLLFFKTNPNSLGFHPYGCPCLGLLALSSARGVFLHAAACAGRRPRALHPGPTFPRPSFKQWTNSLSTPWPYLSKANLRCSTPWMPFPQCGVLGEVSIYSSHKTHMLGVGLAKVLTMAFCRMTHPCPAQWWSNPISKHLLWQRWHLAANFPLIFSHDVSA